MIVFKQLEAADLAQYDKFYSLRPNKTCDSVSLESFIWKEYYHARASIVYRDDIEVGLLWLYGTKDKPFAAMPLCTDEDLPYCFDKIQSYFNDILDKPLEILLADEEAIKVLNLPDTLYEVKEEFDMKDYLYDGDALRSLSGRKLHKKKNHYNNIIKTYGDRIEYRTLGCSCRDDIFKLLSRWRQAKGDAIESHLDGEVEGIHDILHNCSLISNMKMGGVYIDGILEAFSIGTYNRYEDMAVIHIEKANADIDGLYQYINKEFLCHEFPTAKIINREDDLGIEGLRKAKESYYPIGYARKYYVRQKR